MVTDGKDGARERRAGERVDRRAAKAAAHAERRARSQEQLRAYVEGRRIRRRWASRARRRGLAVAFLATVPAGSAGLVLLGAGRGAGLVGLILFLALMALGLVLSTQLNAATRSVPAISGSLDERQRAEQEAAARTGHQATTWLLAAVLLAALVLYGSGTPVPSTVAAACAWALLMLHVSLPGVVLAWTQPDEVTEDDEDDGAAADR
ncbi:hypothetical protein CLV63_103209 [Murinocardiopsis flavida]|uniref:Uncharacterized protein n=2 Tax=Murinocardiopsis flavida TaxID=645275 RepID=A0A2P8DQN3_9ACTN|nr:hypothetical protein CLV63_103209 [Murinocardiopsis flavida]